MTQEEAEKKDSNVENPNSSFNNSETNSNEDGNNIIAACAYLPGFGWIIPLLLKKEGDFVTFHTNQAISLNLTLLVVSVAAWILNSAPLISDILGIIRFHYVVDFVEYITVVSFILASLLSSINAFGNKMWVVPYLEKVTHLWEKYKK